MGFPHQHSTALESSFRRAQGYTDLWPQLANAFQHLVELIKPICISLERNRWYACRRAWGKWVCRKNVGYIGSVKRYTISLKAPLGWYDFYCEPSTQTTWKKTHTPTHTNLGAHTLVQHVPQENHKYCATVMFLDSFFGLSKKRLVFVFFCSNPQRNPPI